MKLFYRFFLIISFVFLALLCWKEKNSFFARAAKPLAIKVCDHFQKNFSECNERSTSFEVSPSKIPAPLNILSQEELQEFPGARVVEALEVNGSHIAEKKRMRILETHFKYPYVRTEEVVDAATGTLLNRCEMVATHLLVRLSAEENPEHFLNQLGPDAIALQRVTSKDSLYRLQLQSHSLAALSNVANQIKNKKNSLLSAEPDFLVHASIKPNNPLYSLQWYLWKECFHINGPWDDRHFLSGIDACDAWETRTSAESVVVAVIDSGIRYTHEDLAANMWHEEDPIYGKIYGWNFSVSQDDPKKSDPMDGFGHGTACAGIIGGVGNSGMGIVGIAWNVKLMALKFLNDEGKGTGVVSDAVSCIDFACEHGAQILNCSWGFVSPRENSIFDNIIQPNDSASLKAAVDRARNQGVIVVAAAGNEGKDNDLDPEYPANYPLDNIISVAATTEINQLAWFSNYGATTVHLGAPGEQIFSTWARNDHDYITPQNRKEILNSFDPNQESEASTDSYDDSDTRPWGTSFSAPQVVGALALLKAQFPTWTYQQLIQRLINTSDKLPALEGKMVGGKLNVRRALSE